MARPPAGPLGNAARDERDDFIGVEKETFPEGPPPRWPPQRKKITRDDFHTSKVTGDTSMPRADRASHFRKGGWVKRHTGGHLVAGDVPSQPSRPEPMSGSKGLPGDEKRAAGGRFKSGGKLTAGERQSLPKSDFALPGRGSGPKGAGAGSYPIPDESHARNALSRSSGKPVAVEVRAKAQRKFPGIGQK